jgi:hypothetical protein
MLLVAAVWWALAGLAAAEAVVTWACDPTPLGKLCVLVGDGWGEKAEVRVTRLADAEPGEPSLTRPDLPLTSPQPAPVARQEPNTLTCELPPCEFGTLAIEVRDAEGHWSRPYLINRTRAEWLSAERAAPGEVVRVFGRSLVSLSLYPEWDEHGRPVSYAGYVKATPRVVLRADDGTFVAAEIVKASSYDVHFRLPGNLAAGTYRVFVHNGHGGPAGWSDPLELTVGAAPVWPQEVFDVCRLGAVGDGIADDTAAIQTALQKAEENHGGIVLFPPGSYLVKATLRVPKCTVLRGQSRERSWIFFPDRVDHGKYEEGMGILVGIAGESDFAVERLSIHGVYSRFLVAAPVKPSISAEMRGWPDMLRLDGPEPENIFIRDCRIYHEPTYHYHSRPDEPFLTEERGDVESKWGVFAAVALRGKNLSVTDNCIKGAGMPVVFVSSRLATLARNELFAGTSANGFAAHGGNYPTAPIPDRCIFEDNNVLPGSNKCHSGFWAHAAGTRYYFARNHLRPFWVSDAEGILFHGFGRQLTLDVTKCEGTSLALAGAGRWRKDNDGGNGDLVDDAGQLVPGKFKSCECLVVEGRGLGQSRTVVDNTGDHVTLDRPWDLEPNAQSKVALMTYPQFRQMIVADNVLEDLGAGIFIWGNGQDCVIDGNQMSRCGGVQLCQVDLPYREWSGNYFVQAIHNIIREGRHYETSRSWTAGWSGINRYYPKRGVGQLGLVFRANLHEDDSVMGLHAGHKAKDGPVNDAGLVLEDNRAADSKVGIIIGEGVSATLRGNTFEHVDQEFSGVGQTQ